MEPLYDYKTPFSRNCFAPVIILKVKLWWYSGHIKVPYFSPIRLFSKQFVIRNLMVPLCDYKTTLSRNCFAPVIIHMVTLRWYSGHIKVPLNYELRIVLKKVLLVKSMEPLCDHYKIMTGAKQFLENVVL